MKTYYLAVDIGASGGRHILGHLEEGRLILEEVYRFSNKMEEKGGAVFAGICLVCLRKLRQG